MRDIRPLSENVDQKMYVVVRNDITFGYQMAQAIHAAVYAGIHEPHMVHEFPTVIVLSARDEAHLLEMRPPHATMFYEPDLGDAPTAFALFTEGSEFQTLPLAGGFVL